MCLRSISDRSNGRIETQKEKKQQSVMMLSEKRQKKKSHNTKRCRIMKSEDNEVLYREKIQ